MKLFKPGWINHGHTGKSGTENWSIYSLDLHPEGGRLATGGMGESGGMVVLWNMGPVRDESAENDSQQPRKLFQADGLLACVNCVRWSPQGQFLASAGDDKIIMIWRLVSNTANRTSSVFGKSEKFSETWRCVNQLRGHSGDILDLAWSMNGEYLASASVDNTVIVWLAGKWPEQAGVLRAHTNMVKGVVWDPVGRYLATQGDDRTVRVWRTSDWTEEAKVAKPFQECAGHTQVLRLTWSPCGSILVAPQAVNNGFPTAQVINRGVWGPSMDLVGHKKHVVCAAVICLALGSKDRSVSVWTTAKRRPLVVVHDMFTSAVVDMTWSTNGQELMCCSLDGTVAYMSFTEEEMGVPLSKDEVIRLHQKAYGQSHLDGKTNSGDVILETPEALALKQQQAALLAQGADQVPGTVKDPVPTGPTKQIESRTKEGRRRITPKFLGNLDSVDENSNPHFSDASNAVPLSSKPDALTGSLKTNDSTSPGVQPAEPQRPSAPVGTNAENSSGETTASVGAAAVPKPKTGAQSTSVATGKEEKKKSVDVILMSNAEAEFETATERNKSPKKVKSQSDDAQSSPTKGKLKDKHRGRPRKEHHHHHKKKKRIEGEDEHEEAPIAKKRRHWATILEDSDTEAAEDGEGVAKKSVQGGSPTGVEEFVAVRGEPSAMQMALPRCSLSDGHKVCSCGSMLIQASTNSAGVHQVIGTKEGQKIWQLDLTQTITAMVCTRSVICVADVRGRLHLIDSNGSRLSPPLLLDAPTTGLFCSTNHIMALSQRAALVVWSVEPLKQVLNESIYSVIRDPDVAYKSAYLTNQGLPVIQLSNGSSYTYHADLRAWVELFDAGDPVRALVVSSLVKTPQGGGLASAQQFGSRPSLSTAVNLPNMDAAVRRAALLDLLECQVKAAEQLTSPQEYRYWMQAWVRHLVELGEEHRLRVVCENLLGPVHRSTRSAWEDQIMGISKRTLLQELLPLFALNLHLQRLYVELKEQLDLVTSE